MLGDRPRFGAKGVSDTLSNVIELLLGLGGGDGTGENDEILQTDEDHQVGKHFPTVQSRSHVNERGESQGDQQGHHDLNSGGQCQTPFRLNTFELI